MSGPNLPAGGRAARGLVPALALAAAAALVFFALGAPLVSKAGMWYDEAVHSQIAIDWIGPSRGYHGPGGLWWMKDDYQGSLKSIVLFAAFKAFGISAETQRGATLGLGALSVFCLMFFAARRYGPRFAAFFAPVLATSPGILLATCYDTGPVAMGLLLESAGILLFGEALRRRMRRGWLFAAGIALGLGVWDKAHFLWLLMAGLPAAWMLRRWSRGGALNGREWAALALGVLAGAAPIIDFNIRYPFYTFISPGAQFTPLSGHLARLPRWIVARFGMAVGALTGTAAYKKSGGVPPTPWASAVMPAAGAAAMAVLARGRDWRSLREPAFFLTVMSGAFCIACLAPLPVKWHHFPLLIPLAALAAMSSVRQAFELSFRRAGFGLGAMALVAALGQISFLRRFAADIDARGGDHLAQRAGRDLARWAQDLQSADPDVRFLCDDSLDAPLLVYTGGRIRLARLSDYSGSATERRRGLEALAAGRLVWVQRDAAAEAALRLPIAGLQSTKGSRDEALAGLERELPDVTLAIFRDAEGRPWASAHRAAPMPFSALSAAWTRAIRRTEIQGTGEATP